MRDCPIADIYPHLQMSGLLVSALVAGDFRTAIFRQLKSETSLTVLCFTHYTLVHTLQRD